MEQQVVMQLQLEQKTSAAAEPPVIDAVFNEECLTAHNFYRELHGCAPLKLSAKLARRAQQWAEHLASVGYLKHSPSAAGNFGENVALKMALGSRQYRGSQAAAQWYSEIELYDFDGVENQARCGHFSQLVWKDTRKAGFGKATSAIDGKMFAVGQYYPPGNKMNRWVANVPRPLSGQIRIPSHEDIMGEDQSTAAASKMISSNTSLTDESNPASLLLLSASQEFGDLTRLGPKPKDPEDKQIGKSTKTRILNGEKSLLITVTFMRPDGSRYQLSDQVAVHDSTGLLSNNKKDSSVVGNGVFHDDSDVAEPEVVEFNSIIETTFALEMLLAHNELRRRHALTPPLRRSESLDRLAMAWAEQLRARSSSGSSDGGDALRRCDLPEAAGLGQSIAWRPGGWRPETGRQRDAARGLGPAGQLARQWYGERRRFRADLADATGDASGGHYSQMVWQSSQKLGIGFAIDKASGAAWAVCFYHPSGNLLGEFARNVLPVVAD